MILHVYLARRFLRSFVIVLAVFIAILLPIDLAEQLRAIGTPDAGLRQAFQLALLNLPGALYRMLPLFIILSTLVLFLSLSRTSELVVVRASGRSALKSTISPVLMSILIGLIGLLIINPLVAATERQYEVTIQQFQTGEERTLSVSGEGLWLRQGNAAGQTVIRAARANADGTELFAASFFVYDEGGQALRRIDADRAALVDGAWQMAGAKIWPLTVANPEAEAVTHETYALASTLTRDQIRDPRGSARPGSWSSSRCFWGSASSSCATSRRSWANPANCPSRSRPGRRRLPRSSCRSASCSIRRTDDARSPPDCRVPGAGPARRRPL